MKNDEMQDNKMAGGHMKCPPQDGHAKQETQN
jgi:hypothetical protein